MRGARRRETPTVPDGIACLAKRFPKLSRYTKRDEALLEVWGQRFSKNARDAIHLAAHWPVWSDGLNDSTATLLAHFGVDHDGHCFHAHPYHWVRLQEPQVTKALCTFLQEGGGPRILAFLRAIAPECSWPPTLFQAKAMSEYPVSGYRIDMLLHGMYDEQTWGAVVEAKFEHHTDGNPLKTYEKEARDRKKIAEPRLALKILGVVKRQSTEETLTKNPKWTFIDWRTLLIRFEREHRGLPDDDDFRRFRRTLWDRSK